MARVRAALAAARSGEPRHLLVGGEAGVGKTRLLADVRALAEAQETRVLLGRCVAIGDQGLPFSPYIEIVRTLVSDEGAAKVVAMAGAGAPDLARLVPALAQGTAPTERGDLAQSHLYEALSGLVRRIAQKEQLVLMLDDLHWADAGTLAATSYLTRFAGSEAVMLVATYRSEADARTPALRRWIADIARDENVERMDLERLGREGVATLALNIVGEDLGSAELGELYQRSDGNPFFVEELLASRVEAADTVPASLRDVLLYRVEVLPSSAQRLLEVAAVGGREVGHDPLMAVAGGREGHAMADLSALVDAGLLTPVSLLDDIDGYSFRHALLQEAVYDATLPVERRRLHRAWAEAIERHPGSRADDPARLVNLAHHWRAAGDSRALSGSMAAAAAAMQGFSYEVALREFEHALELWPPDATLIELEDGNLDRAELLHRTARAAYLASDYPRAVSAGREALDALGDGDPERLAVLHVILGRCLWITGEWGEGIRHYEEAVRIAPPAPAMVRTRALAGLGQIYFGHGWYRRARPLLEAAIEQARVSGARDLEGHALTTLSMVRINCGEIEAAKTANEEAMAIAVELGIPDDVGRAYSHRGEILARSGWPDAALDVSLEGIEAAARYGVLSVWGQYLRFAAVQHAFECGRWDEAARQLVHMNRRGRPDAVDEDYSAYLSTAHLVLPYLVCSGSPTATDMWSRVHRLLSGQPPSNSVGPLYAAAVQLAAFDGRHDEAVGAALEGLDLLRQTDGWIETAELATVAAWPLAETGIAAAARGDTTQVRSAARRMDRSVELIGEAQVSLGRPHGRLGAFLDLLLAQVEAERERMRGRDVAARWRELAEGFGDLGRPYRALMARWRAADAAFMAEDREEAARLVEEALPGARDLGATPLAAQLERLAHRLRLRLATPGTDAVRDPVPFGLTARQREVLVLVAAGRTNREIAEELFISRSTAGVHVSNILGKLGAADRREAAAMARDAGLAETRSHPGT